MESENKNKNVSSPYPKRPTEPEAKDFTRKSMVDWFDPITLIITGLRAFLITLFGQFFDRREVQAAIAPPSTFTYEKDRETDEFWFDYVSDVGDGWNPCYTMALLLAAEELQIGEGQDKVNLKRGRLLVQGGDQVYPLATREDYNNRFKGPYKSALPYVKDNPPDMFAIPGNHDWYDGLTSFMRLFGQEVWIGGWKTKQGRSYFAIQLPHNLWVWGLDVQLESRIDKVQLDYFRKVITDNDLKGHKIILCLPEPVWLSDDKKGDEPYKNLIYFEKEIIRKSGASIIINIAGDMHNYNRYTTKDSGLHSIVAGGGGATLFGTHFLPEEFVLPQIGTDVRGDMSLASCFPSKKESWRSIWGVLWLPIRSLRFSYFLMAPIYILIAWWLQIAGLVDEKTLFDILRTTPVALENLGTVMYSFGRMTLFSPFAVFFMVLLLVGTLSFSGLKKWYLGLTHGLIHIFLFFIGLWVIVHSVATVEATADSGYWLYAIVLFIIAGLGSTFVLALYFLLSHLLFRVHMNEVFAAQQYEDYKNFVRFKIDSKGLSIFPIGVRKVCKKWKYNKDGEAGSPVYVPDGKFKIEPELIEPPIFIPH